MRLGRCIAAIAARSMSESGLRTMESNRAARTMFDTLLENCIFYICNCMSFHTGWVKLGHPGDIRCTTALPPKADVHLRSCYGRTAAEKRDEIRPLNGMGLIRYPIAIRLRRPRREAISMRYVTSASTAHAP